MALFRGGLVVRGPLLLMVLLLVLAACGDDCTTPCRPGINFYVSELAGTLSAGSSEKVTLCLDGDCHDITLSRSDVGGTKFVPFASFGSGADHTLTLTGPGSLAGSYQGALTVLDQSGGGCAACAMGVVQVAADGSLTPGQVATSTTATVPTSSTGG